MRGLHVCCDTSGARLTHSILKDVVPLACLRDVSLSRSTANSNRDNMKQGPRLRESDGLSDN